MKGPAWWCSAPTRLKPTPKIATVPLVLATEKNLDHAPLYCP
ncbi:hypothetical protein ABZT51_40770 [Streptomyces sp. NPDC005373]